MTIQGLQLAKLLGLFRFLKHNNIYYSKVLNKYNDINESNILNIYNEIPLLNKSDLTDNFDIYYDSGFVGSIGTKSDIENLLFDTEQLSENHDRQIVVNGKSYLIETTSGTTGKPLPIVKDENEVFIESKYLNNCRKKLYNKCSLDNGFLIVHKVDKYLKSIDIRQNQDVMFELLFQYMLQKKPKWIFSTTLLMKKYSRFIENKGFDLSEFDIKFIETTSQKVQNEDEILLKKQFNCFLANNYGSREFWNIAYSCKCGELHINDKYLIVDIIDDAGRTIEDENKEGRIIVTSLTNKTTPFVKYLIGDRGKIIHKKCLCGNNSPILVLSEGRDKEKIIGTDFYGNTIFRKVLRTMYFHRAIKDIKRIKIIQGNIFEFCVYLDKTVANDSYFEENFIHNFYVQTSLKEDYKFRFIYQYPFDDNCEKELIFINELKV